MKRCLAGTLAAGLLLLLAGAAEADPVLYGGNGFSNVNTGALVTINQTTGAGTLVGNPAGPNALRGIAFSSPTQLFGVELSGGRGTLVQINPDTGALISTIGPITSGGVQINMGSLSFQPGTGVLYGIRENDGVGLGGLLYTINTTTGVATLVGNTGAGAGGGIAFAPDGTLYQTSYHHNFDFTALNTLDPATGAVLTSVPLTTYFPGLAIRPDGTIFASRGAFTDLIFTIDPTTGAATLVGNTGTGSVSDLAFRPEDVPEPATFGLFSLGVLGLLGYSRWRRKRAG
jgi:hypothetical protein